MFHQLRTIRCSQVCIFMKLVHDFSGSFLRAHLSCSWSAEMSFVYHSLNLIASHFSLGFFDLVGLLTEQSTVLQEVSVLSSHSISKQHASCLFEVLRFTFYNFWCILLTLLCPPYRLHFSPCRGSSLHFINPVTLNDCFPCTLALQ